MNNTDMLEWMTGLDVKFLAEADAPCIRAHGKRKKIAAVIAAAAAAAVCMTAGVGAYLNYNKRMMQYGFGTLGEAQMTARVTPEPVTAENGRMRVTMDCLLCDGTQAMALLTLKSADGDWQTYDRSVTDALHCAFRIGGQDYTRFILYDEMREYRDVQNETGTRWLRLYFELPQGISAAELQDAELKCTGEQFDGIVLPVNLTQNTKTLTMRSAGRRTLTLSAFELYETGVQYTERDWWSLSVTWKSGGTERITYGGIAGSHSGSGYETVSWGNFALSEQEIQTVTGTVNRSKPENWCGFLNVDEVAAFRVGDTVFYPAEE